jgi:hypothetical protein
MKRDWQVIAHSCEPSEGTDKNRVALYRYLLY